MSYHLSLTTDQLKTIGYTYYNDGKIFISYDDEEISKDIINVFINSEIDGLTVIGHVTKQYAKEMYQSLNCFKSTIFLLEFEDEETALYWTLKYLNS